MTPPIFTRTGDKGETGTAGGGRLPKDDTLIHAGGGLDELSAQLSLLVVLAEQAGFPETVKQITDLLQLLFKAGSDLSLQTGTPSITRLEITCLEGDIDRMTAELPELTGFIIPGGNVLLAQTAICRTVTRRVERDTVRAVRDHDLPVITVTLLNRLGDYLFTLERFLGHRLNLPVRTYANLNPAKESDCDE
ncbi:cob(I)yrinic acid a,c-diamide adenosyltransferase [bacterium]|nr:cob(I)yrinic acid a,c-diamide adenosyltransferase [bacterium]